MVEKSWNLPQEFQVEIHPRIESQFMISLLVYYAFKLASPCSPSVSKTSARAPFASSL